MGSDHVVARIEMPHAVASAAGPCCVNVKLQATELELSESGASHSKMPATAQAVDCSLGLLELCICRCVLLALNRTS
jgi:hypothetical protein